MKIIEYDDCWSLGGRAHYIVSLIELIDKNEFEPIILTSRKDTDFFDDRIKNANATLQPILSDNHDNPLIRTVKTFSQFCKKIKEIKADVLHLHTDNGFAFAYAFLAKKVGIKKVVITSHNSNATESFHYIRLIINVLGRLVFRNSADTILACSDVAAKWLYGNGKLCDRCRIIDYFVDVEKFRYDEIVRKEMRRNLGISNSLVFLFVGRFQYQKNPIFLIKLFDKINKKKNCLLYIVGDGELKDDMEREVKKFNLLNEVIFVGTTNEVEKYMCMADVFILTSFFEGNPITVTEAQASGLRCFISDKITRRAKLLPSTEFINIDNIDECVEKILYGLKRDCIIDRQACSDYLLKKGYDKKEQIKELESIYRS